MIIWSWQSWQQLHSSWVIIIIIITIIIVIITIIIVISIVMFCSLSSSQLSSNCLSRSRAATSTKMQDQRTLIFSAKIVSFQKLDKARSYPWKTTKIQDLHGINNNDGFNIPICPGMKQGTSHYDRSSYSSPAAMAHTTWCYEMPVLKRNPIHDTTGRTTTGDLSSDGNEIFKVEQVVKQSEFVCTKHLSFRAIFYRWKKKWKRKKKKGL